MIRLVKRILEGPERTLKDGDLKMAKTEHALLLSRGERTLLLVDRQTQRVLHIEPKTHAEARALNRALEHLQLPYKLTPSKKTFLVSTFRNGALSDVEDKDVFNRREAGTRVGNPDRSASGSIG